MFDCMKNFFLSCYFKINESYTFMLLFKNLNTFSLNIYNLLYKKIIFKQTGLSLIQNFLSKGYQKIGKANIDCINEIKIECNKQNIKDNGKRFFNYKINEKIVECVKKIITKDFSRHIKELEKCYKANIKLSWIGISRNYASTSAKENYSNFFHTDGYHLSLIKVFINLHDVDKKQGALQIVKKKNARKFIKNFKDNISERRIDIHLDEDYFKKMIFENLGYEGEILIANTTELIHRSGVPHKNCYRDMLFLEFVALPYDVKEKKDFFSLENTYREIFTTSGNWFSKEIAKPKGVINMVKQFVTFKKRSRLYND